MNHPPRIFIDACVLVPVVQTDFLLRLALRGLFQPLWSQRVLNEAAAAIDTVHPEIQAARGSLRRIACMNAAFPNACVRDWERRVPEIELPDPDDRHVVAAAFTGQANFILTNNEADFPSEAMSRCGLGLITPDDLFSDFLEAEPLTVLSVLEEQARATRNPPLRVTDIVDRLERCGAYGLAERIRALLEEPPKI